MHNMPVHVAAFITFVSTIVTGFPLEQGEVPLHPRDGSDSCTDENSVQTSVGLAPTLIDWGSGNPWDILQYLDDGSHKGPCAKAVSSETTICSSAPWAEMPTQITTLEVPKDAKISITVDDSTSFPAKTEPAWKTIMQEALKKSNDLRHVDWWKQKYCDNSGSLGGVAPTCGFPANRKKNGEKPDGNLQQNYNTNKIIVDRHNKATGSSCGHFVINIGVDQQTDTQDWTSGCHDTLAGLAGVAGALSIALPPLAIPGGFFGALNFMCDTTLGS